MSRLKLIVSIPTLLLVGLVVWSAAPQGQAQLRIADVSKKSEVTVSAPWFPFRTGALSVTVDGTLDGSALLHIYSNHGRDYHLMELHEGRIAQRCEEAEAWVDDVRVVYEPQTATHGELRMALVCGTNRQ